MLFLEIEQSLFPTGLPVLAAEANPEPKNRREQTHYGEGEPARRLLEVEEAEGNTGVEHEKVIGALPKEIDLQVSGVKQSLVEIFQFDGRLLPFFIHGCTAYYVDAH